MLAFIIASTAICANAQESRFGVRGNMNLSNIMNKYDGSLAEGDKASDYENDFKSRLGFKIGVIYDWGLSKAFYIQPGLYFSTQSARDSEKEEGDKYEQKWNLIYLPLSILASYRIALSDNMKLHINAGPYLAFGLGGKVKWNATIGGEKYKGDYKAFGTTKSGDDESEDESDNRKGGLKGFDAGLSFGIGVSIKKFYVGLNYDLGLANIADKDQ